jgi:hypothetical protein
MMGETRHGDLKSMGFPFLEWWQKPARAFMDPRHHESSDWVGSYREGNLIPAICCLAWQRSRGRLKPFAPADEGAEALAKAVGNDRKHFRQTDPTDGEAAQTQAASSGVAKGRCG